VTGPRQQRGVALLTALLVMALCVSAAVGMAVRGQTDIRRTAAVFERDSARHIALGAEKMAIRLLEQASDANGLMWQECRSPELPVQVDGVRVLVSLDNLQCRYNLNTLAGADEDQQAYFARLVDEVSRSYSVRLPPGSELALQVSDWMSAETDDPVYRLHEPPRYSGNRPLMLASELIAIARLEMDAWTALAPYITVYPGAISVIDDQRSPELLQRVFADYPQPQQKPWFMRLEVVVEFADRRFFQCSLLDASNGLVIIREQTACEP